jgi:hypothetical protein
MVFDCGILKMVMMVFDHWSVGRVSSGREGMEEALHQVEELDQHLATREGGEEVVFVTVDSCCSFVPKVIAVEKNVVDSVAIAAVWAGGVVVGATPKMG